MAKLGLVTTQSIGLSIYEKFDTWSITYFLAPIEYTRQISVVLEEPLCSSCP